MTGDTNTIARLLRTARLEVLPTDSITAEVRAHARAPHHHDHRVGEPGARSRPSPSPAHSAPTAVEWSPALAARMVSGRSHLEDIVDRLHAAGVDAVFVPGGDATPGPGAYT